jgi:hypothetical protein
MTLSTIVKVSFVAAFSVVLLLASTPASLAVPVTKVRLKNSTTGPVDMFFSANCVKVLCLYGAILISKNGYFAYNDESKSYMEYKSAEEFSHSNFGTMYSAAEFQDPGLKTSPWRKGKPVKVFSLRADQYERDVLNIKDNKRFKLEQVTVTSDLPTNLKWCAAYTKTLAPCPEETFPLIVIARYESHIGEPQTHLSCISAQKTDLPLSFFAVPKGYKKARDDIEVFIGGSHFDQLFYQGKTKK